MFYSKRLSIERAKGGGSLLAENKDEAKSYHHGILILESRWYIRKGIKRKERRME